MPLDRLHPSDPSRIAGYRLLARLGAGGMGIVYLGRTDDGALGAVKVIRAEYADEADFRARFRREADIAARVDSPWAVRVLGADPDAAEPWLATAFVPGPSLAEAVAAHGPLPLPAVRILGRALAAALEVMHEQGLVHRDVKPGNVLLGMDGPRLIDFGIARGGDHTVLTSTDVVIGTPGFLPPEQAGGSPAEPAGDVFSLGCLLAYAATGVLPFGGGAVDAVLYRTVHDEPEFGPEVLADPSLTALLRTCLAKHPDIRPRAAEVAAALPEDAPGEGTDWLPDPVIATIGDRAAELLALPGIDETAADPEASPAPEAPGREAAAGADTGRPSRRRFLALASGAAVLAAGGGVAGWLALRDEGRPKSKGPGGGTAARAWAIGVHADLSGPGKAAGQAQDRGVRLAVDAFNSRKDKPFTLSVVTVDDGGRADRAVAAANELIRNQDVFAVIGPTANASVAPCLELYGEAAVPLLSVSSLAAHYGTTDQRSLFQLGPMASTQALGVDISLAGRQKVRRLGLLCDRSGDTDGWQTVQLITRTLGAFASDATCHSRVVPRGTTDLEPVVKDLLARNIDGFFYAGVPASAAKVAALLAAGGFKGPRALDYTIAGPEFLAAAGAAAEGWQAFAPYIGPEDPAVAEMARAHQATYGSAPEIWTAEAYDGARLVIDRLVTAAAGGTNATPSGAASPTAGGGAGAAAGGKRPARAELLAALGQGTFKGITKDFTFGEQPPPLHRQLKGNLFFEHHVQGGRFRYVGPATQAMAG
ncbi:bifunctional serine/threonine-protein kinase/ABC transporter substrate-binding protein [Streptomyces sp. NPDC048603]|uniref:bifunctional serine/threonine-protein kinase/ABC transporter substrate-binding protein n=1 Tax=Streptomyces sp. NPDC048603 TaxID=3365577 RepID=UPI003712816D